MQRKSKAIIPFKQSVIYLDNNGTTKMCKPSMKEMIKWMDSCSNPSSDSIIALSSKLLVEFVKKFMLKHCGTSNKLYTVIFTSGASESNCFILRSVSDAYRKHQNKRPHIITSATEHPSIIKCCNMLKDAGHASITYVQPNAYGCISPSLVERAITPNTALISIMIANNELGCVNDIKRIGRIAHTNKIPFHTDAVQSFGKYKICLPKHNIDALSMSFHKLYGPQGLGMIILSNNLIEGYGIESQIAGSQQGNLRGGTENVPAIAGAMASVIDTFTDRSKKNKRMFQLKKQIIFELEKHIKKGDYKSYFAKKPPTENEFIVLGPECNGSYIKPNVLPNTLLLSFVKNKDYPKKTELEPFCNVKIKKALNKKKIIISIGSACATSEVKASHVLYAIKAPEKIRQGVIRVSLSDHINDQDITTFTKELITAVKKQMPLLD
jgi:cysteine desulfurase